MHTRGKFSLRRNQCLGSDLIDLKNIIIEHQEPTCSILRLNIPKRTVKAFDRFIVKLTYTDTVYKNKEYGFVNLKETPDHFTGEINFRGSTSELQDIQDLTFYTIGYKGRNQYYKTTSFTKV